MHLIFVNRFFYPDHSATSQMLTDLAFGLAARGMRVTVITSRLRYDDPSAHLAERETINGVDIVRPATSRFGRGVLGLRAIDYFTFYLAVIWRLSLIVRRGDIVIAMTDPPAVSIAVAMVARLRGARFVNWLHDIFPEVAEALEAGSAAWRVAFALLRMLRNASLRCADLNVAIGQLMADRIQGFGVARDRVSVIPNWTDTSAVHPVPIEKNRLRADWKLGHKFVIAYSGNLGRAHDIETLLVAIAASAKRPCTAQDVAWLFIGGGAGYDTLRREVTRRGFKNVSFHPYQPREGLAESLSVADIQLVSLKPELEGLIVPSKFYGIAAAGRPTIFIGHRDGEIARLLKQYDCGAIVAIGDALALVETITSMAEDPDVCRAMGDRARAMCEENFSKTGAILAWHGIFEAVSRAASVDQSHADVMSPIRRPRQS